MGCTHYFSYRPDAPGFANAFAHLQMDALVIAKTAQRVTPLARVGRTEYDSASNSYSVSDDICAEGVISLNGVGPDGKTRDGFSCETLWIALDPMSFHQGQTDYDDYMRRNFESAGNRQQDFCKTRRLPYDAVVTGILIRAKVLIPEFSVNSDATWEEWKTGRALYEAALGEVAPCPFEMAVA